MGASSLLGTQAAHFNRFLNSIVEQYVDFFPEKFARLALSEDNSAARNERLERKDPHVLKSRTR